MLMKICVSWHITPCLKVKSYQWTQCNIFKDLNLQNQQ
jgi:hypothetical protein